MPTQFYFDHYAIAVADVNRSLYFYHNLLGMPVLERPAFDFNGAWLGFSHGQALHLIEQPIGVIHDSGSRKLHFAFRHHNLDILLLLFEEANINHNPIKFRTDGIRQIFIEDPDGYVIEFNENER